MVFAKRDRFSANGRKNNPIIRAVGYKDWHPSDVNIMSTQKTPDDQAIKFANTFPIVGDNNSHVDVGYTGRPNFTDNRIPQAYSSDNSIIWDYFDCLSVPIKLNYLGLALQGNGSTYSVYNQTMAKMVDEVLASGVATQLTEQPFFTNVIKSQVPGFISSLSEPNDAAKIIPAIGYETVVLNMLAVLQKYEVMKKEFQLMMDMGFSYEAPITKAMENVLSKVNVYNPVEAIGIMLHDKYVDLDWFYEFGLINGLPSKATNDLQSPLITITAAHEVPDFNMYDADGNVKYASIGSAAEDWNILHNISFTSDGTTYGPFWDFSDFVLYLLQLMDPARILQWTRAAQTSGSRSPLNAAVPYANVLSSALWRFEQACAEFFRKMPDVTVFLKLMSSRTRLVKWQEDVPVADPVRNSPQLSELSYYGIVNDIACGRAGVSTAKFNSDLGLWTVKSIWDSGKAMPMFDQVEGGLNIALSVRGTQNYSTTPNDPATAFPMLFKYVDWPEIVGYNNELWGPAIVNRKGMLLDLEFATVTLSSTLNTGMAGQLAASNLLKENIAIRYPKVTFKYEGEKNSYLVGAALKTLVSAFSMGQVDFQPTSSSTNTISNVSTNVLGYIEHVFPANRQLYDLVLSRAPLAQSNESVSFGFDVNVKDFQKY